MNIATFRSIVQTFEREDQDPYYLVAGLSNGQTLKGSWFWHGETGSPVIAIRVGMVKRETYVPITEIVWVSRTD